MMKLVLWNITDHPFNGWSVIKARIRRQELPSLEDISERQERRTVE